LVFSAVPALSRRNLFRAAAGFLGGAPAACRSAPAAQKAGIAAVTQSNHPAPVRMPVLFVGHGSPMNAIDDNEWSRNFRRLAGLVPEPRAVLAVSAHWFVPGTFTTGNERPETIHDFGGFPRELFEMQYPAAGDPELARRVVGLIGDRASVRMDWGLDHGTWTVLRYLLPGANRPVVQLSIDHRLAPAEHLAIARALRPLRDEGVLILGSGNITHNLRHAMQSYRTGDRTTPPWASSFDGDVARALEQHDGDALAGFPTTEAGRMSHPSLDHYLPVIYAAGAATDSDKVQFPVEGFDAGSLSMRSAILG
jgi:4,5-DOPA dioxygenase extradiol